MARSRKPAYKPAYLLSVREQTLIVDRLDTDPEFRAAVESAAGLSLDGRPFQDKLQVYTAALDRGGPKANERRVRVKVDQAERDWVHHMPEGVGNLPPGRAAGSPPLSDQERLAARRLDTDPDFHAKVREHSGLGPSGFDSAPYERKLAEAVTFLRGTKPWRAQAGRKADHREADGRSDSGPSQLAEPVYSADMAREDAIAALQSWALRQAQRDHLVRAARDAGVSERRIAALAGLSRDTVRRILGSG